MSNNNLNLIVNANNMKFDKKNSVRNSFYITYAFLLTTATITFIEAVSTKIPQIRHKYPNSCRSTKHNI